MFKNISVFVCAVAVSAAGCGLIGDPDSRHGALGHDDVITTAPDGDGDMVCEYPSVLTGARHSVDLRDCLKLEGGEFGEDMTLDVNGEVVTVSEWQTKEGEGEYIGFHVKGDVIIVVKAGTDLHEAGEGTWVHPAGTSGPDAKGISFVAFCEPPTDEPVCTPTGDGGPSGGPGGSGDPSGGGDGGITPSGGGDDGSGGGDGDSGYCDPYTCEPGGGSYGGGEDDGSGGAGEGSGGDGSGSGDGSSTPSGDGSGSGDGGSTSGGDGSGAGAGSDGGTTGGDGGAGACAVTTCGTDNSCPNNHACYSGCCVEVIL